MSGLGVLLSLLFVDTTDVQSARATIMPGSVLLRCNFLLGSQCRGCYVNLIFGSNMTSLGIERVIGQGFVEHHYNFSSKQDLGEILVFDWEVDGSVGDLAVPSEKVINTQEGLKPGECFVANTQS